MWFRLHLHNKNKYRWQILTNYQEETMKVYVVISSYQHGLGEAVEVDAEVFSTIDKARKAIEHKGMNTL